MDEIEGDEDGLEAIEVAPDTQFVEALALDGDPPVAELGVSRRPSRTRGLDGPSAARWATASEVSIDSRPHRIPNYERRQRITSRAYTDVIRRMGSSSIQSLVL